MAQEIGQDDRVAIEYQTSPVTTSEQVGTVTEMTQKGYVVDTDSDLIGRLKVDREAGIVDEFEADDAVFDLVGVNEK